MKKVNIKKNSRGFTLIEVVLVLAIGGLIFLLAFLAFQNASVNRRDTQRRNDAGKVLAEIANAESDGVRVTNQATLNALNTNYLRNMEGPGNTPYTLTWYANTAAVTSTTREVIRVATGYRCADGSNNQLALAPGNTAVIVTLEKAFACRDDQ